MNITHIICVLRRDHLCTLKYDLCKSTHTPCIICTQCPFQLCTSPASPVCILPTSSGNIVIIICAHHLHHLCILLALSAHIVCIILHIACIVFAIHLYTFYAHRLHRIHVLIARVIREHRLPNMCPSPASSLYASSMHIACIICAHHQHYLCV